MFIETQIELESLVHPDRVRKVAFTFRIDDVTAIREAMHDEDDEIDPTKSIVYLNGEPFIIFIPYQRLKQAIRTLSLTTYNDQDNNIQDDTTITPKGSQ